MHIQVQVKPGKSDNVSGLYINVMILPISVLQNIIIRGHADKYTKDFSVSFNTTAQESTISSFEFSI